MNKTEFYYKIKPLNLVKKVKGRFGTIHYQLGHIEGDYQNMSNFKQTFDTETEAIEYLYDIIFDN